MAYNRSQLLNYWFYLLTEGSEQEIRGIQIGDGIGIQKSENIMNLTILNLKNKIENDNNLEDGLIDFIEFRNAALEATSNFYTGGDILLCSPEFSKVYKAFQAVGLITETYEELDCNIVSFENSLADCPSDSVFCTEMSVDDWEVTIEMPELQQGNYYIQYWVDYNGNEIFEHNQTSLGTDTTEYSELYTTPQIQCNYSGGHELTFTSIPSDDVMFQIIITDVSSLLDSNCDITSLEFSDTLSLPTTTYLFDCWTGCSLATGTFDPPSWEPNSAGAISLFSPDTIYICPGNTLCIDYNAVAQNANSHLTMGISNDNFLEIVYSNGSEIEGEFCQSISSEAFGEQIVTITATDNNFGNEITVSKDIVINIGCSHNHECPEFNILDSFSIDIINGDYFHCNTTDLACRAKIKINFDNAIHLGYYWELIYHSNNSTSDLNSAVTVATGFDSSNVLTHLCGGYYSLRIVDPNTGCPFIHEFQLNQASAQQFTGTIEE